MNEKNLAQSVEIKTTNDLYLLTGDGLYQLLSIGVICLCAIPFTMQFYMIMFLSVEPEWNYGEPKWHVLKTSQGNNNSNYWNDSLSLDDLCNNSKSQWRWIKSEEFSVISEFNLYCGRERLIHTTTMLFYGSGAVGTYIMGYLSDRFGRKMIIIFCLFANIVICFACGFSINLPMFMVLRIVNGFVSVSALPTMVVYATETVSKDKRTIGSLVLWIAFAVADFILVFTFYMIQNWRKMLFYSSLPYVAVLVMLIFIPETAPWLLDKGRHSGLKRSLKRSIKMNRRKSSTNFNVNVSCEKGNAKKKKGSFLMLFGTRKMAIMTLSFMLSWFGASMTCVGVSLASSHLTGDLYQDFSIMAAAELLGPILAILSASRFGRKKTSMIPLLLSGVCLLLVAILSSTSKNQGVTYARLCFGVLGKLLAVITYETMATWSAESYPTFLRTTSSGVHQGIAALGMMVAPWVGVFLKKFHLGLPFYVMGGVSIVASFVMLNIKETGGQLSENLHGQESTKKENSEQDGRENQGYQMTDSDSVYYINNNKDSN